MQYLEIDAIGIVILLPMLFFIVGIQRDTVRRDQRYFVRLLVCNAWILLADGISYLVQGTPSLEACLFNYAACTIFFLLHAVFGYLWMQYALAKLYPDYVPSEAMLALQRLPMILGGVLALATPWTGWLYTLTEENLYIRGPWLWTTTVLTCVYWGISTVLSLRELRHPTCVREGAVCLILLTFPIPTLLGNLLQMKYYGLSVVWICAAVSLLILFINLQSNQISRDVLTGLFNRRQTHRQILWEIRRLPDTEDLLFVAVIDVDHFKQINDRFGHPAGDQALMAVADVLKTCCREKIFVGRFGGDEFVLLGHVESREEVEALLREIDQQIERCSHGHGGYELSISTGYQLYSKHDRVTLDGIMSAADREMYRAKQEKQEDIS